MSASVFVSEEKLYRMSFIFYRMDFLPPVYF
jgi:hypothetical protein